MRTKQELSKPLPAPAGIAILGARHAAGGPAEIGRIRREGAGWMAHALDADGRWRPLGSFADFTAALAAIPDRATAIPAPEEVKEARAGTAEKAPRGKAAAKGAAPKAPAPRPAAAAKPQPAAPRRPARTAKAGAGAAAART